MGDIQSIDASLVSLDAKVSNVDITQLASGQLPSTTGTLYTAPASTQVKITTMTFVNTHSAAVTMNLFLLPSGGTARKLIPVNMSLGISYLMVYDDVITMDAGDIIQGDASVASKVDYTISGVTQT